MPRHQLTPEERQARREAKKEHDRQRWQAQKAALAAMTPEDLAAWRAHKNRNSATWRAAHKDIERARHQTYSQEHHAERRAYKQAWREANREREREKDRLYREANAEQERARHQAHYQRTKPHKQLYAQAYYETHKEQINSQANAWKRQNPDKRRAIEQRYVERHPDMIKAKKSADYARRRGVAIRDFTAAQWAAKQATYAYRCVYCPPTCWECTREVHKLTRDHVIPVTKGGHHTDANIIPACSSCNAKKGNR